MYLFKMLYYGAILIAGICLTQVEAVTYTVGAGAKTQAAAAQDCASVAGRTLLTVTDSKTSSAVHTFLEDNKIDEVWLSVKREERGDNSPFLWRWISDKSWIDSQGCYDDSVWTRDLPQEVTNSLSSTGVTPQTCINKCAENGYRYAGVQVGNRCFCGNSFGRHGMTTGCNMACADPNQEQICGGNLKSNVYAVNGGFSAWGSGKPNNYTGYQACGILNNGVGYKFDDEDCYIFKTHLYICQLPILESVACIAARDDDGRTSYSNGVCYFVGHWEKNWFDARYSCSEKGGDLIKISSNTTLYDIIHMTGDNNWKPVKYWIGLTNMLWKWHNGDDLIYSEWASVPHPGYPNNRSRTCAKMKSFYEQDYNYGDEGVIDQDDGYYYWQDADCNEALQYICESGDQIIPTTIPPIPAPSPVPSPSPSPLPSPSPSPSPSPVPSPSPSPVPSPSPSPVPSPSPSPVPSPSPSPSPVPSPSPLPSPVPSPSPDPSPSPSPVPSPSPSSTPSPSPSPVPSPSPSPSPVSSPLPNPSLPTTRSPSPGPNLPTTTTQQTITTPAVGAATATDSFTVSAIAMIVVIIVLIMIVVIITFFVLKWKRDNALNKVDVGYVSHTSAIPDRRSISNSLYSSDYYSDTASTVGLVPVPQKNRRARQHYKHQNDDGIESSSTKSDLGSAERNRNNTLNESDDDFTIVPSVTNYNSSKLNSKSKVKEYKNYSNSPTTSTPTQSKPPRKTTQSYSSNQHEAESSDLSLKLSAASKTRKEFKAESRRPQSRLDLRNSHATNDIESNLNKSSTSKKTNEYASKESEYVPRKSKVFTTESSSNSDIGGSDSDFIIRPVKSGKSGRKPDKNPMFLSSEIRSDFYN